MRPTKTCPRIHAPSVIGKDEAIVWFEAISAPELKKLEEDFPKAIFPQHGSLDGVVPILNVAIVGDLVSKMGIVINCGTRCENPDIFFKLVIPKLETEIWVETDWSVFGHTASFPRSIWIQLFRPSTPF